MSNLRNGFSKDELTLINRRANQLAASIFLLYQQALLRDLAQQKRLGAEINAALVQSHNPTIADDLAAFEEDSRQ